MSAFCAGAGADNAEAFRTIHRALKLGKAESGGTFVELLIIDVADVHSARRAVASLSKLLARW